MDEGINALLSSIFFHENLNFHVKWYDKYSDRYVRVCLRCTLSLRGLMTIDAWQLIIAEK